MLAAFPVVVQMPDTRAACLQGEVDTFVRELKSVIKFFKDNAMMAE